jgi:hypothetical protein
MQCWASYFGVSVRVCRYRRILLQSPMRKPRTEVEEVQLGIVDEPPPGRATADLPVMAAPCFERTILADRLAERVGLLRIYLPPGPTKPLIPADGFQSSCRKDRKLLTSRSIMTIAPLLGMQYQCTLQ